MINGVNVGCGIFIRMQITSIHLRTSGGLVSEGLVYACSLTMVLCEEHCCHPVIYRHGSFLVKAKQCQARMSACGHVGPL